MNPIRQFTLSGTSSLIHWHDDPAIRIQSTSTTTSDTGGNVALAFGFVLAASLFSVIGSALPLLDLLFARIPRLSHIQISKSTTFLSCGLGFTSGVMIFLALSDLYPHAVASWASSGTVEPKYAGLVVWGLMTITFIVLSLLNKYTGYHHPPQKTSSPPTETPTEISAVQVAHGTSVDTVIVVESDDARRLRRMGFQVAFALALHNFPEGLVLFAATLSSTHIGAIYAIAMVLHKLPEGMIMVLPFLFSFKSKMWAFVLSAVMATVGQMGGALLGYVLFITYWNEAITGTLFAVISAFLAWTVLGSMLPMARHYDPEQKYVMACVAFGISFFSFVDALFAFASL